MQRLAKLSGLPNSRKSVLDAHKASSRDRKFNRMRRTCMRLCGLGPGCTHQRLPRSHCAYNPVSPCAQSAPAAPGPQRRAGEGDKAVVSTVITTRTCKAVGEDAARQILGKGLAHIGLGGAVVALAVELTRTGKVQPGLVVLGYCLVKQRTLEVAKVVAARKALSPSRDGSGFVGVTEDCVATGGRINL